MTPNSAGKAGIYEARVLAWNDEHLEERFYTFAGMALSDGVSAWLADKRAFDRVVTLRAQRATDEGR